MGGSAETGGAREDMREGCFSSVVLVVSVVSSRARRGMDSIVAFAKVVESERRARARSSGRRFIVKQR